MDEVLEADSEQAISIVEPEQPGAADDQMAAGFSDVETPTAPLPVADAPTPEPEIVYARIPERDHQRFLANAETIEKIAASYEHRLDTAFGHIGGLQQKLKEMQAATPAGQSVTFSKDDFAEMQAEFPELADMQMKGIERAMARVKGTGTAIDATTVSSLVKSEISDFKREFLKDTLTDLHEDWETVVGPPDSQTPYRTWLAAQTPEYQTRINTSLRPGEVAKSIEKFTQDSTAKAPAPPKSNPAAEARRQQLADAVTPRGAGGSVPSVTAEQEMSEAFRNS